MLSCAATKWLALSWLAAMPLLALAQSDAFEKSFRAGSEAMRAGNLEEAARDFSQAAKLNPAFAEADYNLGLVQIQQGQFDSAIASLKRALVLKPRLRGANLFLGIAYYRKNRNDDAITALERETTADP